MKLGTYTFPTYFSLVEIQNSARVPTEEAPRRPGVVVGEQTAAEKIIRIEGNLSHATDIRTTLDSLKAALMGGRQKFYSHADRFIYATAQNLPDAYDPGLFLHLANIEIELLCDDPFWQAETLSPDTWNTSTLATPVGGGSKGMAVGGNAPAWPIFELTVAGSGTLDMELSLGSLSFTLGGAVTAGQIIVVDCFEQTVTLKVGGTDKITLFDGVFFSFTANATNTLSYEDYGGSPYISQIYTTWRNRWY